MTGDLRNSLHSWPPKDWRALAALVFSVAGAVALTVLLWLLAGMLLPEKGWTPASEGERVTTIRWVLWLSAFCILLVLTGLGFAINRRALRGRWGDKSLDWEGGEDDASEAGKRSADWIGLGTSPQTCSQGDQALTDNDSVQAPKREA